MYKFFKPESDHNYEDKQYIRKIENILADARKNNRTDLIERIEKQGTILNSSGLKKFYYDLAQVHKGKVRVLNRKPKTQKEISQPSPAPIAMPEKTTSPAPTIPPVTAPEPPLPPSEFFDPLTSNAPKERGYTSGMPAGGGGAPPVDPGGTIPEPSYSAPSGGLGSVPPNTPDNRFSQTKDLPQAEKNKSARDLAKIAVDLYSEKVPQIFTWLTKIKESNIREWAMNGEVDLNLKVNLPHPQNPATIVKYTVAEYFQVLNVQSETAFETSEEFKAEILPHVEKILQKRDWGVTDEQVVLFMVANDLFSKGMMAMSIKGQISDLVDQLKETTSYMRKNGTLPNEAAPSSPSASSPNAPEPPPSPPEPPSSPAPDGSPERPLEPEVEEVSDEGDTIQSESFTRANGEHLTNQGAGSGISIVETPVQSVADEFSRSGNLRKEIRNTPPPDAAQDMPTVNGALNQR